MEFLLFESRFGRGFASGRSDRNHEYSGVTSLAVCSRVVQARVFLITSH